MIPQRVNNILGKSLYVWMRVCFLVVPIASVQADDFTIQRKAYAYSMQQNNLLYIEQHEELWRDNRLNHSWVRYYAPNNTLLAEKKIDFSKSHLAPSFELNDSRDGYLEGATAELGKVKLFARRNAQQTLRQKMVEVPDPVVIDGGFDQFVKTHWNLIQQGKRLHFNFVAPIEQDFFAFSVQKKSETLFADRAAVELEMRPDSTLVRMFVKPIRLLYDSQEKSLLQFEGMTNLNDNQGKSYVARLVYPPQEVKRVSLKQKQENLTIANQ